MRAEIRARRFQWSGVCAAIVVTALGLGLLNTPRGIGVGLHHLSYDLPLALRPSLVPDQAVIIFMDDESHNVLGQSPAHVWDRALHARLLDRLTADHARSVTFDVFFRDPSPAGKETNDLLFAEAIKRNGRVCLAVNSEILRLGEGEADVRQLNTPYEPFMNAAANLGSVEVTPDDDLVIRRHLLNPEEFVPSLALATIEIWKAPANPNATNRNVQRWMNYYGPPATVPWVKYWHLFTDDPIHAVPPGAFRGKAVFVGGKTLTRVVGQRKDEFSTPFSWRLVKEAGRTHFMAGVELQATAFLNLLRGDWLSRTSPAAEWLLIGLVSAVFGFGLVRLQPVAATVTALAGMCAVATAAYVLLVWARIWFPWAILVFPVIPVAWAWSVADNSLRLLVQSRLYEQSIAMYLSPKLVRKFARQPEFLKPGAEKQMVSILFSDIANFTHLAEGIDPDDLARVMNQYFDAAVTNCIHTTDGTVVKFIGDAIFAIWNAPDQQPDHRTLACGAALRLRDQVMRFEYAQTGLAFRTRIGLHTGLASVGNFGSSSRIDFTAFGESVNLASRMEGLNKHLGTSVLATRELREGVRDDFLWRHVGNFRLKGFERFVEVYELVGTQADADTTREWREAFAAALQHFHRMDFAAAEAGFRQVLEIKPGDGPSTFYLDHLPEFRSRPPAEDWLGEVELKEK